MQQDIWSNYWKTNAVSSQTGTFDKVVKQLTQEHWHAVVAGFPENGTLLDLGCGSGDALALLLKFPELTEKTPRTIGLDSATSPVDKSRFPDGSIPEFLFDRSIENTHLEANSVDLCVSQFGFEYCDLERGVVEVSRILKNRAKFAAVIHHADGVIAKHMQGAIAQNELCKRSGLLQLARELIEAQQANSSDARTSMETLRNEINRRVATIEKVLEQPGDHFHLRFFIRELAGLFKSETRSLPVGSQLAAVDQIDQNCQSYQGRSEAMLAAARSQMQMEELKRQFIDTGFDSYSYSQLGDPKALAWFVRAHK